MSIVSTLLAALPVLIARDTLNMGLCRTRLSLCLLQCSDQVNAAGILEYLPTFSQMSDIGFRER